MAVRLVINITAVPGKGAELAQAMKGRCEVSQKDAGCEQFEVFQSALNPDRLVLLERWSSQAALDAHGQLQRARPPRRPGCGRARASARITSTTARDSRRRTNSLRAGKIAQSPWQEACQAPGIA